MSTKTVTVAATAEGSIDLERTIGESGIWPVDQSDLDREVTRQAEANGWTVVEVGEPIQRGPLPMRGIDPETEEEIEWRMWQLYAHVEVEQSQNGAGSE